MDTNTIIIALVSLCSLGGWYVILAKYIEMKTILKERERFTHTALSRAVPPEPTYAAEETYAYTPYVPGQHMPGMGPAPLLEMPQDFPYQDYFANYKQPTSEPKMQQPAVPVANQKPNTNKREVCNWASIMHLSGFGIITGIPLLNIIIPTVIWLLKKEQHPFLAKNGREVINFQITLTLIQILCLLAGTFMIWACPTSVGGLLALTKTIRIVFGSGMQLPFNLFTFLPFMWACVMMLRGTVAAYNGLSFVYPLRREFIVAGKPTRAVAPTFDDTHVPQQPARSTESMKFSFG